jgi:uncharacterized protein YecE (DUF72 family)
MMTILIGCSGWSYDDWVGRFYPMELAKKKGEWLAYYAKYFHTVEINSTFYRPPGELQVASWIRKGAELNGFEYSLKMPQLVTHKSMVQGEAAVAIRRAIAFEMTCIRPLSEAGLLGCVLLQLSPYFQRNAITVRTLESVLDALSFHEYNYAVEFRHRSWLEAGDEEIDPEAMQILKDRNVASVLVDGPGLRPLGAASADHYYVRFHGRNYDIWYRKGKDREEGDFRLDRYDYLYGKEQLCPWVPLIKEADLKAQTVRIYFNNHARSKSARNAFQLMDLLMLPHVHKEIRLQNQFTLGSF